LTASTDIPSEPGSAVASSPPLRLTAIENGAATALGKSGGAGGNGDLATWLNVTAKADDATPPHANSTTANTTPVRRITSLVHHRVDETAEPRCHPSDRRASRVLSSLAS
jgi:hypothetical protein